MDTTVLPLKREIRPAYTLSYVAALLMAGVSLAGLFYQSRLYPSEALRQSFVSNDVVNLFIGLPMLLASMALARRGKLLGLLCWPGALFYITYNYLAYAFAIPPSVQFPIYLALVILSVSAIFVLLWRMDAAAIRQRLDGAAPARFAGGVLLAFGILFLFRSSEQVVSLLTGQVELSRPELGVLAADLLSMPAWMTGGALLWRRRAFGYASGAGLLFQASMLFIGLLAFFILQPFLTGAPFPLEDFVVIFVMGLVCFVPFGLFVRSIMVTENL